MKKIKIIIKGKTRVVNHQNVYKEQAWEKCMKMFK